MNGTNVVTSAASNIYRINYAHATSVGTNGSAVGTISIRNTADTIIYAQIPIAENNTQQAFYTVPAGYNFFLNSWQASSVVNSTTNYSRFQLMSTTDPQEYDRYPGIFFSLEDMSVQNAASIFIINIPYKLSPGTDVKISAMSNASNSHCLCSGLFEGWLEAI
jgi:hypothetical protein